MKASYKKYELQFKQPAGTSRGVYKSRLVWFLFLEEDGITGIGECSPLPGLSIESPEQVEVLLAEICADPKKYIQQEDLLTEISSVRFAFETALIDLRNGGKRILFDSKFSRGEQGIPINGLIWMGELEFMKQQVQEKLDAGFHCIKLKIGAVDFQEELSLLKAIRNKFSNDDVTLRVDANGAFRLDEASSKLKELAKLGIHSIEQPIAAAQWGEMAQLCKDTVLPIALDEELIGINSIPEKKKMLDAIHPHYLVLKPSLHGGLSGCDEWIQLAEERNIRWWITSYLESNLGLNAIAQWCFMKNVRMHQGLGTGQLFTNNISSPLEIRGEELWFDMCKNFDFPDRLK